MILANWAVPCLSFSTLSNSVLCCCSWCCCNSIFNTALNAVCNAFPQCFECHFNVVLNKVFQPVSQLFHADFNDVHGNITWLCVYFWLFSVLLSCSQNDRGMLIFQMTLYVFYMLIDWVGNEILLSVCIISTGFYWYSTIFHLIFVLFACFLFKDSHRFSMVRTMVFQTVAAAGCRLQPAGRLQAADQAAAGCRLQAPAAGW